MEKTTIYLSTELRRAVKRAARLQRRSEADVIRDALSRHVAVDEAPRPTLPLFRSRGRSIADRVDDALADGFGRK